MASRDQVDKSADGAARTLWLHVTRSTNNWAAFSAKAGWPVWQTSVGLAREKEEQGQQPRVGMLPLHVNILDNGVRHVLNM
jgi:hypothetical protein